MMCKIREQHSFAVLMSKMANHNKPSAIGRIDFQITEFYESPINSDLKERHTLNDFGRWWLKYMLFTEF